MNQFINTKTGMKRLQFGTSKCVKMHVGKTCNPTLCRDLFVGGWKEEVITDPVTGKCSKSESFEGPVKMGVKEEQMYLGDLISANGKHASNVQLRKNKGLGAINSIMQILKSTYFGKFYFEVALVLRESLFLSSLLLNSEAWVNLTDQDIRKLEQSDEILLSRILDCETNTSNTFKYLELGIYPLRYEIIKRKTLFLQYILQQDQKSMLYQIFDATCQNPVKNDFVQTCKKYLDILKIDLSFEDIKNLSKWKFKKLVKEKTREAAFEFLIKEQNKPGRNGKVPKISCIKYEKLELQEYLHEENKNTKISQFIFKARCKTLEIKTHKKWKFEDKICTGCKLREETGDEVLSCEGFGETLLENQPKYEWFYSNEVQKMIDCAKVMIQKLKKREKLIENG